MRMTLIDEPCPDTRSNTALESTHHRLDSRLIIMLERPLVSLHLIQRSVQENSLWLFVMINHEKSLDEEIFLR